MHAGALWMAGRRRPLRLCEIGPRDRTTRSSRPCGRCCGAAREACSSAPTPTTRVVLEGLHDDEVDALQLLDGTREVPAALRTRDRPATCSTCSSPTGWSSTPATRAARRRRCGPCSPTTPRRCCAPPHHHCTGMPRWPAPRRAPLRRGPWRAAVRRGRAAAPRRSGHRAPGLRGGRRLGAGQRPTPTPVDRPAGGPTRRPRSSSWSAAAPSTAAAAGPWRARGIPVLPVVLHGLEAVVGPVVVPGRAVPALPGPRPRRPRPGLAGPARPARAGPGRGRAGGQRRDHPRRGWPPSMAAMVALAGARRAGARRPGRSLEVSLPWPRVRQRQWAGHPRCGCGAGSDSDLGDPPTSTPPHRREWPGERTPPPCRHPHGPAGQPAPRLRRAHRAGARQAGRRQAGRGRRRRAAGAHRRAAVQGARRAQGRGDEVRPGDVGLRGGAARGDGRALPRHADQAAGGRARRCPPPPCTRCWPRSSGRAGGREVPVVRRHARPRPPRSARCTRRSGATAARSPSRSSTPARARPCSSDLNQLARVARLAGGWIPGMDIKPIIDELKARMGEELDYNLEAGQPAHLRQGVPRTTRTSPSPTCSSTASTSSSRSGWTARRCPRSSPSGTQEQRDAAVRSATWSSCSSGPARAGLLHADPHPGNFRLLAGRPARRHRLRRGQPAARTGCRRRWAAGQRGTAVRGDAELDDGLRREGFIKPSMSTRRRGAARLPRSRSSSR